MGFVGLHDTYAESGTPDALLEKYGLTAQAIVDEAERLLAGRSRLGAAG
jgi:transketolase